jgi:hypothetical protein
MGNKKTACVAVLDAKVKLGELLANTEKKYAISSVDGTNRPQRAPSLPANIDKKKSHEYQTRFRNTTTQS